MKFLDELFTILSLSSILLLFLISAYWVFNRDIPQENLIYLYLYLEGLVMCVYLAIKMASRIIK